jgi:uncharacterized protein (TIGR02996 family)
MDTGTALLKAVLAAPDDDLPRLVYADWLEENGRGEHAEFVRAQVELAASEPTHAKEQHDLSESPSHWCDYCRWQAVVDPIQRRVRELAGLRHPDRPNEFWVSSWVDPGGRVVVRGDLDSAIWYPPPPRGSKGYCVKIERGFVAEILCSLSDWMGGQPCPTCEGQGLLSAPPITRSGAQGSVCRFCPYCEDGRDPSVGKAVLKSHPVVRVKLTTGDPYYHSPDKDWNWFLPKYTERPYHVIEHPQSDLPPQVFHLLGDGVLGETDAHHWRAYPSRELAERALSAALIAWAKAQPAPEIPAG